LDQLAARGRRQLAQALRLLAEVEETARRGGAEREPGATAASDQGGAPPATTAGEEPRATESTGRGSETSRTEAAEAAAGAALEDGQRRGQPAAPGDDRQPGGEAAGAPGQQAAEPQRPPAPPSALASLADGLGDITAKRALLHPWRLLDALAPLASTSGDGADGPRAWLDDLLFGKKIAAALEAVGRPHDEADDAVDTLALLLAGRLAPLGPPAQATSQAQALPPLSGAPSGDRDPETVKSQAQETAPAPLRQGDGGPSDSEAQATEATDPLDPVAAETPAPAAASPSRDLPAAQRAAGSESPPEEAARRQRLGAWLAHPDVRHRLRVHEWDGRLWLHRESFEELLWWSLFAQALEAGLHAPEADAAARAAGTLLQQAAEAGWCLEHLLAAEARSAES
jgi:hypothetical protein